MGQVAAKDIEDTETQYTKAIRNLNQEQIKLVESDAELASEYGSVMVHAQKLYRELSK